MDRRIGIAIGSLFVVGAAIGLFVNVGDRDAARAAPSASIAIAPSEDAPIDPRLADLDTRIEAATRLAESRGDDWVSWERIALLYVQRGQISGGYDDYGRAEEAYERAFAIAPTGAGPYLGRATLEFTLHRLDRVAQDLDVLERQAVLMPNDRALMRALRADVAFQRGDYDTARRLYEEQLADARSAANLVALAQLEWKTGAFDRAETLLDEARDDATAPGERAWLALVRGLMERDRGRHQASLASFEEGLRTSPDDRALAMHAADAQVALGEVASARRAYEGLLERSEDPQVVDRIARLAREQGERGLFEAMRDRARTMYEEQLETFPEAAYGHALEHFLELEDDVARAVELAERNRDLRPGGEARTRLAQAYLRAGRIEEAVAEVTRIAESPWDTADAHATAALVWRAAGDRARAEDEEARAEAIAPGVMERLAWLAPSL